MILFQNYELQDILTCTYFIYKVYKSDKQNIAGWIIDYILLFYSVKLQLTWKIEYK